MPIFDHIGNTLKALRVFLLGKGVMTLAVAVASVVATTTGISLLLPIVAIGGVVITAAARFYRENLYQNDMVNLYRDDLAQQFGIPPEDVTRSHLKEAARSNDVIDQALKRIRMKTWVGIGTAALASAITVGLVGALGVDRMLQESVPSAMAGFVGVTTVAGLSGLVFNHGLRVALGYGTSYGKAAAHDRIQQMDDRVRHGRAVTKEQVYGVMVAADSKLQESILHRFGKRWRHMHPHERTMVLNDVGVAADMQVIADQINRGEIRPGKLAYLLEDAYAMANDPAAPPAAATGENMPQKAVAPSRFVERIGRDTRPVTQSYVEQIKAERLAPAAAIHR